MNHEILKSVLEDQKDIIRSQNLYEREYQFENNANYVLIGLRRAGKSALMYKKVLQLIQSGVKWEQIIYLNFEDERLSSFNTNDFNDIIEVQHELSDKTGYYFFDEIQNIDNWDKFCRRLADAGEKIWITGSNAKMLIGDALTTLGARYWPKTIYPYNFKEYLNANNVSLTDKTLSTKQLGMIKHLLGDYFKYGGLPESLNYENKREYIEIVYQKMQLGDVIQRNDIRNPNALKTMMYKLAETVCSDISYSKLTNSLKSIGYKISKETLIDYISFVENAFIIFRVKNFTSAFVDKETNCKYYFTDNGILNLFLVDKNSKLLENIVAIQLHKKYGDQLWFLKSSVTGIDLDFVIPERKLAIQVAYSLNDSSIEREIKSLVTLAKRDNNYDQFYIITYDEEDTITIDDIEIKVIPLYKFLINE